MNIKKYIKKYKFDTTQLKELKHKKLVIKDKLAEVSEQLGIS